MIAGALIGLLGGLVGLILGALRMPALLKYVGETPARAVGTNMTVGVCVGAPKLRGVVAFRPIPVRALAVAGGWVGPSLID